MRIEEAKEIAEIVRTIGLKPGAKCLNLGSSTRAFRETAQPHILAQLIKPLEADGLRFVHCDMKADDGVDLVGDALDPAFQARLAAENADLLLCCNMLEHLADPMHFVRSFDRFLPPGGYAVLSVPYSYPYHPDPIDTLFRPSPGEIAKMFGGWRMVTGRVVKSSTYLQDLQKQKRPVLQLLIHIGRILAPFYRPQHWFTVSHRILWLFRRYSVSIVVMQKPPS